GPGADRAARPLHRFGGGVAVGRVEVDHPGRPGPLLQHRPGRGHRLAVGLPEAVTLHDGLEPPAEQAAVELRGGLQVEAAEVDPARAARRELGGEHDALLGRDVVARAPLRPEVTPRAYPIPHAPGVTSGTIENLFESVTYTRWHGCIPSVSAQPGRRARPGAARPGGPPHRPRPGRLARRAAR